MNRLMLDFETLDVADCPVILSIGAVVFNENGIVDCISEKIDQQSCLDLGCTISDNTIAWWDKQSKQARDAAFGGKTNIGYAMGMLVDFYKKYKCNEIWSKGSVNDVLWANNILQKLGLQKPWKFSREMCFRTYLKYSPKVDFSPSGEAHNALDDAINQARHWITINKFMSDSSDLLIKSSFFGSELNKDTNELINDFSTALKAKLLIAQEKYGFTNNWLNGDWETDCQAQLMEHIYKGDPLDVAAYCAFKWFHNWETSNAPTIGIDVSCIDQPSTSLEVKFDEDGSMTFSPVEGEKA